MRAAALRPNAATGAAVALPAGLRLQRQCACAGRCDDCRADALQKRATGGARDDDAFEAEADRIADRVLRDPAAAAPARVHALPVGRRGDAVPASVDIALRGGGRPIEPALRQDMETRFGHDFSRVLIHTGDAAERSARDVDAHAYTVGRDIVFGAGQFAPASEAGRRLMAHELTHVVQQGAQPGAGHAAVQRKPDKAAPPKASAASAPKLELSPSKNGAPCACLMVVHNDERNARKTAGLMHANCAYNLALVNPDTSSRLIKIPGQKGPVDPNSMFPREIAEKCLDDEQGCRDFVSTKSGSTDKDEIEQVVQTQFFLAVSDCSAGFTLPVVALHNNDVEDTKNYSKEKDKQGVGDLKMDVDKRQKETGDDRVAKLKELIKKKFGDDVEKRLIETKGKTNIFRWCASKDLSQCHIGDPDHPDNVTWVTNARDFAALSKKDLNVALQSEAPTAKGSESEGDLSTLFPLLKDIFDVRLTKIVASLEQQQQADWDQIDKLFAELDKLKQFGDQTPGNTLDLLMQIVGLLIDALEKKLLLWTAPSATSARIAGLRYINTESPGKRLGDQSDAERVRNYETIVDVLKAIGLDCCGADPKKAEDSVKEGLKAS